MFGKNKKSLSEDESDAIKWRLDPRLMQNDEPDSDSDDGIENLASPYVTETADNEPQNECHFCANCGNLVLDAHNFCRSCGEKQ